MNPGGTEEAQGQVRAELRAHKRERILETATRLFHDQGYRATSMESIADELSATKPFIYYHFRNKYDILDAIATRVIERGHVALVGANDADAPPEKVLAAMVRSYAQFVMKQQPLVAVFWREQGNFTEATRERVAAEERSLADALVEVLERGATSGAFTVTSARLTALSILNLVTFTYAWYRPDGAMAPETIAEHFVRSVLAMVGASSVG